VSARVSAAATVVAPDMSTPIKQLLPTVLLDMFAVSITSALVPETVAVTAGPLVERSV